MIALTTFVLFASLSLPSAGQYTNPAFANTSGPTGPLIDLTYTKVQGTTATFAGNFSANAWLGIRYAQNPTGPLRLGPPVPVEGGLASSNSTFDSTTFGPICYGGNASAYEGPNATPASALLFGNRQQGEDCLLLDIYAPTTPVSNRLPVLVYIHGGGYVLGSSTLGVSPGDILASLPGQVLVVSVQYRLSGFGFLGGAQIAKENGLNAGLQDQRLALNWVQSHISAFGGDPDRVVIDGGSAGGGSVIYQLLWNGGEQNPPYRAAMAEFPGIPTLLNGTQLETQFKQVLSAANCTDLGCLQSISTEQFDAAQQTVLSQYASSYAYGLFYYGPYVDGKFIQDLPSTALSLNKLAPVPLLTSRHGNEGHVFTPANVTTTADYETYIRTLFPNGDLSFFNQLELFYPTQSPPGPYAYNSTHQRLEWLFGDAFIACISGYAATAATNLLSLPQTSPTSQNPPPVWKFIFAYPSYSTSYHGSYGPYVYTAHRYNTTDISPPARIARSLTAYFTRFILNNDPNQGDTSITATATAPFFPSYGDALQVILVGADGGLSNITDLDAGNARCQFLQAHPLEYSV